MLNQNYDYETQTDTTPDTWEPNAYARDGRLTVAPHDHLIATPAVTAVAAPVKSDPVVLGTVLQAVQQTQQQQMYMLRDMDSRLARLEETSRAARYEVASRPASDSTMSFERSTWWAIWGLLMLVMGAALAVVIILLISQIQLR